MATIVADDALAEAVGEPIDVDILEIKLTLGEKYGYIYLYNTDVDIYRHRER